MATKDIEGEILVLFRTNDSSIGVILGIEKKKEENTVNLSYEIIKLPQHNILDYKDIHLDEKIKLSIVIDKISLEKINLQEVKTAYMVVDGLEVEIGSSMPTLRVSAKQENPQNGPPTINSIIFTVLPVPEGLRPLINNPQDRIIIALRKV